MDIPINSLNNLVSSFGFGDLNDMMAAALLQQQEFDAQPVSEGKNVTPTPISPNISKSESSTTVPTKLKSTLLPETVKVVKECGSPVADVQVILVKVSKDKNGNNEEILQSTQSTDVSGEVTLKKDLPTGVYVLRTLPKDGSNLKAKEFNLVIPQDNKRNSIQTVIARKQSPSFAYGAGLTPIPSDEKTASGNSKSAERTLIKPNGLKGKTILIIAYGKANESQFKILRSKLESLGLEVVITFKLDAKAKETLVRANQLWIVSECSNPQTDLTASDIDEISSFYKSGKSLFLWGDNHPYTKQANQLGEHLLGITMSGDLPGDKNVTKQFAPASKGFVRDTLFTGLSTLYEGFTIATIDISKTTVGKGQIQPVLWGSANNLVTIKYKNPVTGSRLIMDAGHVRLYDSKIETVGTTKFILNCAGWLANLKK